MNFALLLRALTLCSVALLSGVPIAVHCKNEELLPPTTDSSSLKATLELTAKLYTMSKVSKEVYTRLNSDIEKYCSQEFLKKFLEKNDDAYGSSGYLPSAFLNLHDVRGAILASSGNVTKRETLQSLTADDDTVRKYADILEKSFPQVFSALYYLYFNGSDKNCKNIKGGSWKDFRCNQTGSNQYLGLWLTDKIDSTQPSQLLKRGFASSELGSSNGEQVSDKVDVAVNATTGGSLQNVLYALLFVGGWHDAKSGHGLRFLYEFCLLVKNSQFGQIANSPNATQLTHVCEEVRKNLEPLVHRTNAPSGLYAVSSNPSVKYEHLINRSAFVHYAVWLLDNLPKLIKSLEAMVVESTNWTDANLKNGTSAGPFKYGFVFKPDRPQDPAFSNKLKECVDKLTKGSNSLQALITSLASVPRAPVNSGSDASDSDNSPVAPTKRSDASDSDNSPVAPTKRSDASDSYNSPVAQKKRSDTSSNMRDTDPHSQAPSSFVVSRSMLPLISLSLLLCMV